jgi:nicotinamide-nucleotide amidase
LSEDTRGRGFIISLPGVPRELEYMMTHTVIPLLVERMGGAKIIKAKVLRTCAVGESNIDRAIGDLMLERNPTVGLSAHSGQTDVRITAKAETEAEADALIAIMEAKLRERLGIAVYGVDKETVAEVVGRLLVEKGLKLGVVDTLTGGQLARELTEAGFSEVLAKNLAPATPAEAGVGLPAVPADGAAFAAALAEKVAPAEGLGLALLGPLSDGTALPPLPSPFTGGGRRG